MARIISILATIILILGVIAISQCHATWLSDAGNPVLKDFVDGQLLPVLGVIVTITLASAANLHLELNRLEVVTGETFREARAATKAYAFLLIGLLAVAVLLLVLKHTLSSGQSGEALFNGFGLIIIFLNILALADLTLAVFEIPARPPAG